MIGFVHEVRNASGPREASAQAMTRNRNRNRNRSVRSPRRSAHFRSRRKLQPMAAGSARVRILLKPRAIVLHDFYVIHI
jgi:hypothetical protein